MKLSTIAHHSTPHIGERDSRGLTHPCNGFADCFIADAVNFCFTADAVNFLGSWFALLLKLDALWWETLSRIVCSRELGEN